MYAKVPDGKPKLKISGNLRPTNSALKQIKEFIMDNYDDKKAT